MLGRKQEFNLKLNELLDSFLLLLAGVLSYKLRVLGTEHLNWITANPLNQFYWIIAIVMVATPLILELLGYYKHPLQKSTWKSLQQLLHVAIWLGLIIGSVALFGQLDIGPRSFLPIFAVVGASFLLLKDYLARRHLKLQGIKGEDREKVLIVGAPGDTEKFLKEMPPEFLLEVDVVDRLDINSLNMDDLAVLLKDKNIERVFVAAREVPFIRIEETVSTCEVQGVEAWLWTGFIETSIAKPTFDTLGGRPMLVFRSTPDVQWALAVKSVLDKIGALVGILLLIPVWVVIYIGIKISSPGAPVIFKQKRSGKYGKPFTMYKFRSMVPDAEAKRLELVSQNTMSGPVFKIERDPRIFPFGAFLRKSSLDETPQFINVLKGEMSLVGPRPLAYYEAVNVADAKQRRRFSVKPGLTCLWQISGRNNITEFDDWCALDLKYIDNWSIWLDIKIILLTIPVFFGAKGAK